MGDVSEHFSRREFECHGFMRPGHVDHATPIDPELLVLLEKIRAHHGEPLFVVSGHRCAWWNHIVGGAGGSTHMMGEAADIAPRIITKVRAQVLGSRGTGYRTIGRTRWAIHVDVRHAPSAVWSYD